MLSLSELFHSLLSPSSRSSLVPLHFLPLECYHLHIMVFLPTILIPVYNASSSSFHTMHSAYKLNKQGDNIQLWCTPFSILNQFIAPCIVLIVTSWPVYWFLRRHVRWSGILISWRMFQFSMIQTTILLPSIWQQIWKTQQWPQDWKWSVLNSLPKRGKTKEYSNYHTTVLISHTSKAMLKF